MCHMWTQLPLKRGTVTVTVTGTAGVKKSLLRLDSWIAAAEQVSLQTASEGGKRRCRRDVVRQTVPNTGCMSTVSKRLDDQNVTWYGGRPRP